MIVIRLTTFIAAPIDLVFDLARSIDLHMASTSRTGECAIAGVRHGLIDSGETVTWRGKHFGLWLQHASIISGFNRPVYFQDSMLRGRFKFFAHNHFFESAPGGTLMRDELTFAAPFGPAGWLVERWLLRRHLTHLLENRNQTIKLTAESDAWRDFLPLT